MRIELSERRQRQIAGVLLVALGLVATVGLASYRAPAEGAAAWTVRNAAGPLGAALAHALLGGLGRIAAWAAPLALFAWGVNRLRARPPAPLALETAFGAL